MQDHDVVIAGGGPTGLMLAAELALANVDVAIVERRVTQDLASARARGFHARTIEVFDQRGIAERFLAAGQTAQVTSLPGIPLPIDDFPTRHPYGLALLQTHTERILAEWVAELPVTFHRACELVDFTQDEGGVDLALADGRSLRAQYLVGCDGGRSIVRKKAGIDFPGWDASTSFLIAEAALATEPPWGIRRDEKGTYAIGRAEGEKRAGIVLREEEVGRTDEPTLADLRAALVGLYGTDFGVHDPTWISRFTDMTRQAASYRRGRVLLAGDAAHVHAPVGGQGLNLGVQDAFNLGWKLAQVVRGTSPTSLLDSYHAERHPIGTRALRLTMALSALGRGDSRTDALRDTIAELVQVDDARRRLAASLSALDIRYDLGEGHPLLGRRMPDLDLIAEGGPVRVYVAMRDARPLLLNLGEPGAIDLGAWTDRVRLVEARYDGTWELPVIGNVSAPSAVLIRPDGHVAWVGEGTHEGLRDALTTWFDPG